MVRAPTGTGKPEKMGRAFPDRELFSQWKRSEND